jgi:TolB-like protein
VVLPFDNLSPDPNDAYLAGGLTEELTADLGRLNGIRVIARNSAAAAHQRTTDLKEIARILDVRYLLEGSVRRAGKQLRITAQLIDGTTDAHLWAEKYGGTIEEVFEMQERISRSIVEELRAWITPQEAADRTAPVTDAETYELYLRAKHMLGQSLLRMPEATPLLEEVMSRDPAFAPAYCALGTPLVVCAFFGYVEPKSAWTRIQALADRALSVNPRSGPAHELLAAVTIYRDWNWAEAKRLYQRARELEPGAGFDHVLYAFYQAFLNDKAGAIRTAQIGRSLDPLNVMSYLTESVMLAYAGDFDGALPLALSPVQLDPQFPEGYHIAGYVHLGRKEYDRAASLLERGVELSHRAAWPVAKLGCALVGLGRSAEARTLLDELEQRAASDVLISAPAVATLHLHLGDHAAFYRWMHRAMDERDPFALSLNGEYLWHAARHEPEFHELLCRVGLAKTT